MDQSNFEKYVDKALTNLGNILKEKNISYGGSAVNPLGLFIDLPVDQRLLVRIEDKLMRIKALGFKGYEEDNLGDLVGYFIILKAWQLYKHEQHGSSVE